MRLSKILLVWLMLAGLMFCNGVLRVAFLVPLLGVEAAEMMSVFIGISIVFAAPRPFLAPLAPLPRAAIWRVSLIWVAATIAFEAGLGRLGGRSWSEIAGSYSLWTGSFWPVILFAVGFAPFLWLRGPVTPMIGRVTK
jgi:hypothetical protein